MIELQSKDICWVEAREVPISDDWKDRRPFVIVQSPYVTGLNTILGVYCTSRIDKYKTSPTSVFLPEEETGLPANTVALCHLIYAIPESLLGEKAGTIPPDRFAEVQSMMLDVLDI